MGVRELGREAERAVTPDLDAMRPEISAVMPCLNEALTLGECIDKALECFRSLNVSGEVVVADNGSTDGSQEIALRHGARVVHQPIRGYGAALRAGMASANGRVIVMADADGSYDWGSLGPFLAKIDEGYDVVIGNRFKGGIMPGAMPPLHRYLGNPVLSLIARFAFRAPIGDFHCGIRALTAEAFGRMPTTSNGMEFATEMIASSVRSGLRIAEIPAKLYTDKRNRPPHLRSFRDGWRHLRYIVTYAPDQLYLWPGSVALLAGIALQAVLCVGPIRAGGFYMGIHFLALGGLLTLLGVNVLLMGLMAKLVVSERYGSCVSPWISRMILNFRLEVGLLFGGGAFVAGFVVAIAILFRWLGKDGQPMDETVHPALVALNAMATGVCISFASFLVHLLIDNAENAQNGVSRD